MRTTKFVYMIFAASYTTDQSFIPLQIVAMGYTESLTLPQIQTILIAESHEERIQEMITRNKELEAAEESKRKTKQLEMARREAQRAGASARSAHIGGFGTASPLLGSGGSYQAVQSAAPIEDQYTYVSIILRSG